MVDVIKAQLDRAKEDDRVKAVILKVDSPGGEVMASDEINKAIAISRRTPAERQAGNGQAGGLFDGQPGGVRRLLYFRALPLDCGERTDDHRQHRRDHARLELSRADGQGRRRPMTYKSGKFKDMLSGERSTNEVPAEEQAMVQGLIDETYGRFTNVVCEAARRRTSKTKRKARRSPPTGKFRRRPRVVRLRGAQTRLRG